MSEANSSIATEPHDCGIIADFYLPGIDHFLRNCTSKHQLPERVQSGLTADTAFQLDFGRWRNCLRTVAQGNGWFRRLGTIQHHWWGRNRREVGDLLCETHRDAEEFCGLELDWYAPMSIPELDRERPSMSSAGAPSVLPERSAGLMGFRR